MKFVYLDKKDRVRAWFTPGRTLAAAALELVLLILPLWHESVSWKVPAGACQPRGASAR